MLLLDTHVVLWAVSGHGALKASARKRIASAEAVYVSAASIWEVAIKARLGKIEADGQAVANAIEESGMLELPVTARHAAVVASLPMHHADPFDRLLIAQALCESLRLITADRVLASYGANVEVI